MDLSKQNIPLLRVSLADDLCPDWKPIEVKKKPFLLIIFLKLFMNPLQTTSRNYEFLEVLFAIDSAWANNNLY